MADNTGQPLGQARVDFIGDTSKLEASAKKAEQIVKNAAGTTTGGASAATAAATPEAASAIPAAVAKETAEVAKQSEAAAVAQQKLQQATVGVNAALKSKAASLKESFAGLAAMGQVVARVTGLLGLATAAVGALVGGWIALNEWADRSNKAIERANKTLKDFAATAEGLLNPKSGVERDVETLETAYKAAFKSISEDSNLDADERNRRLIALNDKLYASRDELERKAKAAEDKRDRDAAQQRALDAVKAEVADKDHIRNIADARERANLDGMERIDAEERANLADLATENKGVDDEAYRRAVDATKKKYEAERQAYRLMLFEQESEYQAWVQERIRTEREASERIARQFADAMEDAFDRVRSQGAAMFSSDGVVLGTLNDIRDTLNAIATNARRGGG